MNAELLILRHGKSDWSSGVDDYHRPLRDRGKRGAQRMGVWLLQQDLVPDYVISSPAERALVTAQKSLKAMGLGSGDIQKDSRVYAADANELLAVLADCPVRARRVMIVGHNPGLEDLLVFLAEPQPETPEDGKLLPTATLARLKIPCRWDSLGRACAQLKSITRPDALPKKFPYPSPAGSEQRDRPAYYYTQSSVIPYRWRGGVLEILVISSSKKKHLVVPKGIKDPGLSPRESAAKEAWEEAGVEGTVGDTAIGSYRYTKWGATCTVEVFPMEVTRVIAEHKWEERHRGREWVTPKTAARGLKQEELKPMVMKLASMITSD